MGNWCPRPHSLQGLPALWEVCHCHHGPLLVLSGRFLTFSSSLARIIVWDINKCKIHRSGYWEITFIENFLFFLFLFSISYHSTIYTNCYISSILRCIFPRILSLCNRDVSHSYWCLKINRQKFFFLGGTHNNVAPYDGWFLWGSGIEHHLGFVLSLLHSFSHLVLTIIHWLINQYFFLSTNICWANIINNNSWHVLSRHYVSPLKNILYT